MAWMLCEPPEPSISTIPAVVNVAYLTRESHHAARAAEAATSTQGWRVLALAYRRNF